MLSFRSLCEWDGPLGMSFKWKNKERKCVFKENYDFQIEIVMKLIDYCNSAVRGGGLLTL